MDVFGHHALSCKNLQCNSIVDGLHRFITRHNTKCSKEAVNPLNATRQRPGDFYIPIFDERGGDVYFDVSVLYILAPSYIQRASKGHLKGCKFCMTLRWLNILIGFKTNNVKNQFE